MARINKIDKYIPDTLITDRDMVIGSDISNALKTKNYFMIDIKKYIINNIPGFDQNNFVNETTVSLDNTLNQTYDILIQEYLNTLTLVVGDKELAIYRFYIVNDSLDYTKNITISYLWGLGKGTFIHPLLSGFRKLNSESPNLEDIQNQPNTVTIDLGVISTSSTFVEKINTSTTEINLSNPLLFYLITFLQNGKTYYYKFIGQNGIYGATGLQCTINDFEPFALDDTIITKTSDLINDGDDGINPFISLNDLPSTFPPSAHTHPISDVINLQLELDSKASTTHASTHESGGSDPIFGENLSVTIVPPTANYVPTTPTLKGHLQGIDTALGNVVQTTAGIYNRIWFTGDQETLPTGTYFKSSSVNEGTVLSISPPSLSCNDNERKYFTQDIIGTAFPILTKFPAGIYAGQLSVRTTPNSAQQQFGIEIYKTSTDGTPIASGITGAIVGTLGVTVVAVIDSGILTLVSGSIMNINIDGRLNSELTINVGERIRYHVFAEKVGTTGGALTMEVFYGSNHSSQYDTPVIFDTNSVLNRSSVPGTTTTNALESLLATIDANTIDHLEYNNTDKTVWNNGSGNQTSNTTFGENSLIANTNGVDNSAFGFRSLYNISGISDKNTALGSNAGRFFNGISSLTGSTDSVYIGYLASALANNSTNEIVIGSNAIGAGNNSVTIGDTFITKTVLRGDVSGGSFVKNSAPTTNLLLAGGGDIAQSTFQPALGFTPENVANKATTLTASSTAYPNNDAVIAGLATKEPSFAKNTAFNKDFGTTAGTVAEGNYSPAKDGTGATGTWGINISGTAVSADGWNGLQIVGDEQPIGAYSIGFGDDGKFHFATAQAYKNWLGLGSNAYTSTAYLPLSGGMLGGDLLVSSVYGIGFKLEDGFLITREAGYTSFKYGNIEKMKLSGNGLDVIGNITASQAVSPNQVVVKSQLDAVAGSSGTWTPANTGVLSFTKSYWVKSGNIVSFTVNGNVNSGTGLSTTITLPNSFNISSPVVLRNIGMSKLLNNLDVDSGVVRIAEISSTNAVSINTIATVSGTYSFSVNFTVQVQ